MKLAILDRDGVINHDSDAYIKSPEEWVAIEGSAEAIARLSQNGYIVVVATNQSGIARGLFDTRTLQSIHQKMVRTVEDAGGKIAAIFYCPHADADHCACRKPADGLIREALRRFNIEPENAVSVGDSLRDLLAAKSAGIRQPVLVRTGKGEKTMHDKKLPADTPVFADLERVVDTWLEE
jgi:D-glycero-D-manno-heptose 1,7-bisphosphate phosphatase